MDFLWEYYAKRNMELLALNRNQLREVTGQYHFKGYLFKLANRPTFKRHYNKKDIIIYVLYGLFNDAFSIDIIKNWMVG
jgi:quercetin dioxygenase-like cupin family protein